MYVDVHTHLDVAQFDSDRDAVVQRAKDAGVKVIIANGTNPESNRKVLELSKKYDIVKPALGAYPTDIIGFQDENVTIKPFNLDEELDFIKKQDIAAIGEVGLDDHHVKGKLNEQKKHFERIIQTAEKMKVPLIVHSRKAESDTIEMLESSKAKVVMHCFGGGKKHVKRCIENKWSFSIPVSIVRATHFQMIVRETPMQQLLTETDAPYLGPNPGERNEPSNIPKAVEAIAKVKDLTVDDAAQMIFQNYQRMF